MEQTVISAQFNGPDTSGNGGYVCGLLADQISTNGSTVGTSSLRQPPPLEVPLTFAARDGQISFTTDQGIVIGTAEPGEFVEGPLDCPTGGQAKEGLANYRGFINHPFDRCFTCGTQRGEGDGLRLFTGPFDEDRVAAPWTPHAHFTEGGALPTPIMWAALDCPGGWSVDFSVNPTVLGRMTAQVLRSPKAGEQCLSIGGLQRIEGRKFFTNTALYTIEGELLGRAEQIWIKIDPAMFN